MAVGKYSTWGPALGDHLSKCCLHGFIFLYNGNELLGFEGNEPR